MKKSVLVFLVAGVAMAGCGGGGGGSGTSSGAGTCEEFFSDARMCQFTCAMATGTSATTVASTLHVAALSVGHGCMSDGAGGMECLMSCKDSGAQNQDVAFYFDSGDKLYHVTSTAGLPQCLVDAGCQ